MLWCHQSPLFCWIISPQPSRKQHIPEPQASQQPKAETDTWRLLHAEMPGSELRCPRHVCLFYPPVWIRTVTLTNSQCGKYLKQTHLFTKSESVLHWVWLTWGSKPDLTWVFYLGQAQQLAAASGEAFSPDGWVRLSLVKGGVIWLSMARPGWHYDTLPGEAGFVTAVECAVEHAITAHTDPQAISWWFLTQQAPWVMPAPHLSGNRWYPVAVASVLQCSKVSGSPDRETALSR